MAMPFMRTRVAVGQEMFGKVDEPLTPIPDPLRLLISSIEHWSDYHKSGCNGTCDPYERNEVIVVLSIPSQMPRMNRTANRAPKDLHAACANRATAHTKMLMLGIKLSSLCHNRRAIAFHTSSTCQPVVFEERDSGDTILIDDAG